jgi:hypothetical protein
MNGGSVVSTTTSGSVYYFEIKDECTSCVIMNYRIYVLQFKRLFNTVLGVVLDVDLKVVGS